MRKRSSSKTKKFHELMEADCPCLYKAVSWLSSLVCKRDNVGVENQPIFNFNDIWSMLLSREGERAVNIHISQKNIS